MGEGHLFGSNNLNDTVGDDKFVAGATLSTNFAPDSFILFGAAESGYAANDFRQIVGSKGNGHAFAGLNYPSTTIIDLGTFGGSYSTAFGINNASQITGYAFLANGDYHAFLYAGSTMTDLGALNGSSAIGYAINSAAQITGTYVSSSGVSHAFLYLGPGAMYDLNNLVPASMGATNINETDYGNKINDLGQIAATGTVNGNKHGLLLTPRSMGTQFTGGLGDLPNGALNSAVNAVANVGTVVAGQGSNVNGFDAMTWTLLGEMKGANFNSAGTSPDSAVYGISADGTVIVGRHGATTRAFRMAVGGTTPTDLANLPNQSAGAANAVDTNGIFSTGWSGALDASFQHAVRWDGSGSLSDEILPLTGGGRSVGTAISGNGSVVTGWSDYAGGSQQAFRWSSLDGITQPVGFLLSGGSSMGMAVSSDGSTIVGRAQSPNGYSAFRWTQSAGMQDLGDLIGGTYDATAKGVSADGSVVVGAGNDAGGAKAFVWDKVHGMRDLQSVLSSEYGINFPGWRLGTANAISPDASTVGGSGTDPLGNTQAWMAQLNSRSYRFVSGESYGGGVFHTSRLGGFGSSADLLGGSAGGAAASFRTVTVAMQATNAVITTPTVGYCSDIANVTGTSGDIYVVQISYDSAITSGVSLGWFNGTTWVTAVDGNTGGNSTPVIGAFDGNLTLGRFGADTTNHVAWAVLNHGGQFTVLRLTSPPTAAFLAPTDVGTTFATFNGIVNAQSYTTALTFQYGTDGNTFPILVTPTPSTLTGSGDVHVSAPVAGLIKGTTYYYRISATNAAGTTVSGTQSFTTLIEPVATVGGAFALTTTSAQVSGMVRARNSDAQVFFDFGTDGVNFPNSVAATPAVVTGNTDTIVSAALTNLLQSVTYYYRVRAVSAGGTATSTAATFQVAVLSGFLQQAPIAPPEANGFILVNTTPAGVGGWRFVGEQLWRSPGTVVGGLTTGDRRIEFKPAPGYYQPVTDIVSIISGGAATVYEGDYATIGGGGATGAVFVQLKPDSLTVPTLPVAQRAQWRFLGENDTQWKESGDLISGLVEGTYLIESKPLAGRTTPATLAITVGDGQTVTGVATYYLTDTVAGTTPGVLSFDTVTGSANMPYQYVGQLRTDSGSGTGFVVKARVVATAAHVVFDDGTLSAATNTQWVFERDRASFEPVPQVPRGFYMFTGYATQRQAENTPGTSAPASQTLDAAAVYFLEDAGRGGFGGYLASDGTPNEWLTSGALKTLVGYPVTGISTSNQGRMFATVPANVPFTLSYGRTYTTSTISSVGGNSGGPLCVQYQNGSYYPAAIYLGGTGQTVVRVIDSDMVDMFSRAAVSANGGADHTGGGISQTNSPVSSGSTKGVLRVTINSPAGARWGLSPGTYTYGSPQQVSLTANRTYTAYFQPVAGFIAPNPYAVAIYGNTQSSLTVTYGAPSAQGITLNLPASRTLADPPLTLSATASSGYTVTFSLVSGPATLSGSTLTPTGMGTVTVQADQAGDGVNWLAATLVQASITITADNVNAWNTRNFTAAQLSNAAISGPLAAPAGDGVNNLLKFAFNMSPWVASNARLVHLTGTSGLPYASRNGSGNLAIEYIRRKASGSPGISYAVEFASSPGSLWNVQSAESSDSIDATFERVTVTDSSIGTQRYGRVRVSSP